MSIRPSSRFLISAVGIGALLAAGMSAPAIAEKGPRGLEVGAMAGLPAAYTGTQNPQRGLNGGGCRG